MSATAQNKTHYQAIAYTAFFLGFLLVLFLLVVFTIPSNSKAETILYMEPAAGGDLLHSDSKFPETPPTHSNTTTALISGSSIVTDKTETTNLDSASTSKNEFTTEIEPNLDPNLKAVLEKANVTQGTNTRGTEPDGKQGINISGKETGIYKTTEKQPYVLNGRTLLKKPGQINSVTEEGIVVVEIVVDEKGKVIKAIPGQRGSTTTSTQLYAIASQKAKEAEFNSSPDVLQEQHGTYTFVFRLE